jgi:hypothetical protein
VDEEDFTLAKVEQDGYVASETGYDTDYVVDLTTGNINYESMSSSIAVADIDETDPAYYQFFCTVSILAPMNDEQSESESELTPEESQTSQRQSHGLSSYGLFSSNSSTFK